MPDTRKRRWFQIHLSTAVMLMFAAGGMIWANLDERKVLRQSGDYDTYYGWPFPAWKKEVQEDSPPDGQPMSIVCGESKPGIGGPLNAVVNVLLLIAVWRGGEWWIRWRAMRKGA